MTHEEIKDAIGAYSIGALEVSEREILEEHLLAGCSECEEIFREMQVVTSGLLHSVEEKTPPSALKARILTAIETGKEAEIPAAKRSYTSQRLERKATKWSRLSWAASFALILIVMGLGIYINVLKKQIENLTSQVVLSERVVADLRGQLTEKEAFIKTLQSPEIRFVDLQGLDTSPNSKGKIIWNPQQNKAIFLAFNLPAPPVDKDYQLWMLRSSQPIDAGIFLLDAEGLVVYLLDTITDSENLTAFAVTLEDKGGVPQPTLDQMYLLGAVTEG